MEKTGKRLCVIANWVVRIVGGLIFLVLTWYALRYTQYMIPLQGYEYPIDRKDSMAWNGLTALLMVVLLVVLLRWEQKLSQQAKKWIERAALALAMSWQGVWGLLWITAADRCPKGDQEAVYNAAAGFLQGNYQALGKGGYCEIYPHQLGLAFLEEIIFRVAGRVDYHVIQWIYVAMIVGTVCFVYGILKEFSGRTGVIVTGTLLAGACVAPIFYSCWVYGEVPSVFFMLWAAWSLAGYLREDQVWPLAGFVMAVTFAVLVRKNSLIFVVAFCLVGLPAALAKKDRKLAVAVLLAVLAPNLCYSAIFGMYELRSGYKHSEGLPANGYIYVGLQETDGRFGWDYLYSYKVYDQNGRDTDRTREALSGMIAERLEEMRGQKGYMAAFMKGKVLSQWNAPLYQSMYFNYVHEDVRHARTTAFLDRLSGAWFEGLLWTADRLQFLIYFGMFLYFVLCVKPDSELAGHLLAVTIIGGFFFSILWEAKTRYVFPYYMMMFPLAAQGYERLAERTPGIWGKVLKAVKRTEQSASVAE